MKKIHELQKDLNIAIDDLSEKSRMHRKIRFLLDIRGLLVINKLSGAYAEFGVYRGEMMYCASKVLSGNINQYFGFDTFEGLPGPEGKDEDVFVFEGPGFMKSPYEEVKAMLKEFPNKLVKGDFRHPVIQKEISNTLRTLSVLSIDCNWPSSVRASLTLSAPYLQSGSIIYFDDYFVGTREGDYTAPILKEISSEYNISFELFQTYPPCARSFIVM